MRRYYHYMQKAGMGKLPRNVLLVDAVAGESIPPVDGRESVDRLASWTALLLTSDGANYTSRYAADGTDEATFWTLLNSMCRNLGAIQVISYRACRVWALLGLWEGLHNEHLFLTRKNKIRDKDDSESYHNPAGGYCILSDPPNIIRFRIADNDRWITWIDCRNFSAEPGEEIKRGDGVIAWLCNWWHEYIHLCDALCLGAPCLTIGSQALMGFKRSYLDEGIYCHTTQEALALEMDSYYGGRCEVYRMGMSNEPLYYMDIRSAYGSIMQHLPLPVRLIEYSNTNMTSDQSDRLMHGAGVARVMIETPLPIYPVRNGDDVIYPIGRFTTCLSGSELSFATRHYHLAEYLEWSTYHLSPALKDIADALLTALLAYRAVDNRTMSRMVKSLIVSLVGKLGQRCKQWDEVEDKWGDMQWGEWYGTDDGGKQCKYRSIAGYTQQERSGEISKDAVPAIAAFITSRCRMILWNMIGCAGQENTYYVDTDGMFVNKEGYDRLAKIYRPDDGSAGSLTLREPPGTVEIKGIKYYIKDGIVTCAGMPKGSLNTPAQGQSFVAEETPYSAIRAGQMPHARTRVHTFHRPEGYKHGVVSADGRVSPIVLKEW